MTVIYCRSADDIPKKEHWAIIHSCSVSIPGDQRSREAPGHGYPAHTEQFIGYEAYDNEKEFTEALTKEAGRIYQPPFIGIHVDHTYGTKTVITVGKNEPKEEVEHATGTSN